MPSTDKKQRYHHGDARNALINSASALIETIGAAGLSLRQVAERAGLSRQAPYNHFEDKAALLAELVRDGFEHLARDMRAAIADAAGREALARVGDAYLSFAQHAPARFRLMFSREMVDLAHYPTAAAASDDAFAALTAVIATFAAPDRIADLSLAAWSLVHGYATLCIEVGIEPPKLRKQRAAFFAALIRAGADCDAAA